MSGVIDGVSKLWVLRIDRGSLDLHGVKNRVEAIDHLIRVEMLDDDSDANKARVRAAVEEALKHTDEPAPKPRPRCTGCNHEIDPDTCHCGEDVDAHNVGSGHSPVPMGCTCHVDGEELANG